MLHYTLLTKVYLLISSWRHSSQALFAPSSRTPNNAPLRNRKCLQKNSWSTTPSKTRSSTILPQEPLLIIIASRRHGWTRDLYPDTHVRRAIA